MINYKRETWLRMGECIRKGCSEEGMALLRSDTHSLTSPTYPQPTLTIPGAGVFLTPSSDLTTLLLVSQQ